MNRLQYISHKQQAKPAQSGGIGCLGVIGIIFVVLKLLKIAPVATWSWWWVLSPFIAQLVLGIVILVIVGLVLWTKR